MQTRVAAQSQLLTSWLRQYSRFSWSWCPLSEVERARLESKVLSSFKSLIVVRSWFQTCPAQHTWNHIHHSAPQTSFCLSLPGLQEVQASPCAMALPSHLASALGQLTLASSSVNPDSSQNTPLALFSFASVFTLFLLNLCSGQLKL